MAAAENSGVVLLSIRPCYAQAIIEGRKKVEFRRRAFARPVDHVVIYASYPIQKVTAFFSVTHITEASPRDLWSTYRHVARIEKKAFDSYYDNSATAVAIGVGKIQVLTEALALHALGYVRAPQSFVYLSREQFRIVCMAAR
jgi:predicted transcriptional regulator